LVADFIIFPGCKPGFRFCLYFPGYFFIFFIKSTSNK